MRESIEILLNELKLVGQSGSIKDAEHFYGVYLGKKGKVTELFNLFKNLGVEEKKALGPLLNQLKSEAQACFDAYTQMSPLKEHLVFDEDLSKPGSMGYVGGMHPLSIITNELLELFTAQGFIVQEGNEIDDDWHNFSALNFAHDHPARDMQDTFFVASAPDVLLRTQTSNSQIRYMGQHKPPIRAIFPGRVYRNEAISARAHCIFHQIEALVVDEAVSFADLKQTLLFFIKGLFGADTELRLRPNYFPFTEPSAELDMSCHICKKAGCNVCKYSGWVELGGCGMVHPNVLRNCHVDPDVYQGFAFGFGIDRMVMMRYGINDIRLLYENNVSFIRQFNKFIN